MSKYELIQFVIKQIKLDLEFEDNDLTALEILLNKISESNLKAYLPEDFDYIN